MRYTFATPEIYDLNALAILARASCPPGRVDGIAIDGDALHIDFLAGTEPLTGPEEAALAAAVAAYAYTPDPQLIRAERDKRINEVSWRYERNAREQRLGLPLSDDLAALDAYIQALADVPGQPGFPAAIEWPVPPA